MNGCLWHGGEIMTGQQAIDLIHERSWVGRKPGLERTQALTSEKELLLTCSLKTKYPIV